MIEEKKVSKFMRAISIALEEFRTRLPKDFRATGTSLDIPPKDVDRFWANVEKGRGSNSCWLWTGNINRSNGYGRMNIGRKLVSTHRISYFLANGDWPQHTDHLCSNRSCVNPKHLESVTMAENIKRAAPFGHPGRPLGSVQATCKRGHQLTADNIIMSGKFRTCAECRRMTSARYKASKRSASA